MGRKVELALGIISGVSSTSAIGIDPETGDAWVADSKKGTDWQDDPRGSGFAIERAAGKLKEKLDSEGPISYQVSTCVLAVSGLDNRFENEARIAINRDMNSFPFTVSNYSITSLPEAGHFGAFLARPGILVRCGHGSSVYLVENDSTQHFIGGWGDKIGDPGSGPDIGRKAMRIVGGVIDGVCSSDELAFVTGLLTKQNIPAGTPVIGAKQLIIEFETNRRMHFAGRKEFASREWLTRIAKNVLDLAEKNDVVAVKMTNEAVEHLMAGLSCYFYNSPASGEALPICFRGTLIKHSPYFASLCMAHAIHAFPSRVFAEKRHNGSYSSLIGLGLLALAQSIREGNFPLSASSERFLSRNHTQAWASPNPSEILWAVPTS